jgi:ZU5 domain
VRRWAFLCLAVVAAACSIQTIFPYGTGPAAGTASQLVGATGGVVTANDGTTVLIPPNALTSNVTITIGLDPNAAPLTSATALATPHVFGPVGQEFLLPVCVTLAFEPGLLPQGTTEQSVVLYASPPDAGAYTPLPTFASDPAHVTGMTTQFATMIAAVGSVQELGPDAGDAGCGEVGAEAPETGF